MSGSAFEDSPPRFVETGLLDPVRFQNHFHNPLTGQGLTDGVRLSAKSAATWAISDSENDWSWRKARAYLFEALTGDVQATRDDRLAKLFRSIGQIVHLVQDSAVAAHVRNDNHGVSSLLSGFSNQFDFFESVVERSVDPAGFSPVPFDFGPNFPLAWFWDSDTYRDSPTAQSGLIGLSEYTSYNFFSEDTIFTENLRNTHKHYFPHPRKELTNAELREEQAEDGTTDRVYYVQGYDTVRLATYSYFYRPILDLTAGVPVRAGWLYHLDESVIGNNANILIPKAISYSAGLINYFFRGKLGVDRKVEFTNNRRKLTVKVFNETSGEDAVGGSLVAVARYRPDAQSDEVWLASEPTPVNGVLPRSDAPLPIAFTFSQAIPSNAVELTITLAYRGRLGVEDDAVIGRVFSPIHQYVFIIQEGATLTRAPIVEDLACQNCGPGGVFLTTHLRRDGVRTVWNVDGQLLSGRFVATDPIVAVVANLGTLFVNGHEFPNGAWQVGDTAGPPLTWQLESLRIDNRVQELQVTMTDGSIFVLAPMQYVGVGTEGYKELDDSPYQSGRTVFSRSSARLDVFEGYLLTPDGFVPGNDLFDLVQLSGAGIDDGFSRFEHTDNLFTTESLLIGEIGYTRESTLLCNPCDPGAADFYDGLPPPAPAPLLISGEFRRVYGPDESDALTAQGVEPEAYTLTLN